MEIDAASLDRDQTYRLLVGAVVPRPIAFISTVDRDGVPNVAPFSWTMTVCPYPPVQCFSSGRSDLSPDGLSDTLRNALDTGEFVVNVVTEEMLEAVVQASDNWPRGVSEFAQVGLTPAPSRKVRPPRVAQSPISMECRLLLTLNVDNSTLVLGRVVYFHIRDDLYREGHIDIGRLGAVGRLGRTLFCRTTDLFQVRLTGQTE